MKVLLLSRRRPTEIGGGGPYCFQVRRIASYSLMQILDEKVLEVDQEPDAGLLESFGSSLTQL